MEKIQYVDLFPDWNEGLERLLQAIELGDNLVGGNQFEEMKKLRSFNVITRPLNVIRRPFNRSGASHKPALSPSMLLLVDSSMEIDKHSIRNSRHDSYHTPIFSSCLGSNNKSSGSHDGQFDNPTGIPIDGASNYVYVADKDNHRIQKFDSNGTFVAKWGSKGSDHGQFDRPESLCIDRQKGSIFVVESKNHRIQLFVIPRSDTCIRKGTFLFSLQRYDEALQSFEKALKIDQKYAYAWVNKGASFYKLGRYDEALQSFEKALEIDQKYAYAWVNKGKSQIHIGRYQDARESFNKSIELDQNNIVGLNNIGLSYYLLEEYDKAIECFTKSLVFW